MNESFYDDANFSVGIYMFLVHDQDKIFFLLINIFII